MVKYPAQIDDTSSLPIVTDNLTPVSAETVNRLRDAILAIELELGVNPAAVNGTVKARLDSLSNIINNLNNIQLAGDLGNSSSSPKVIGIQGFPVSSAQPTYGQILGFNGMVWVPQSNNIVGTTGPTGPIGPTGIQGVTGTAGFASIPNSNSIFTGHNATNVSFTMIPSSMINVNLDTSAQMFLTFNGQFYSTGVSGINQRLDTRIVVDGVNGPISAVNLYSGIANINANALFNGGSGQHTAWVEWAVNTGLGINVLQSAQLIGVGLQRCNWSSRNNWINWSSRSYRY